MPALRPAAPSATRSVDVVRIGRDRVRIGPWRGDPRIAQITPCGDRIGPPAETVRACVDLLAAHGYRGAVTSALAPHEQDGFLRSGFEVHEQLHLLARDLDHRPPPAPAVAAGVRLRRARRRDHDAVLGVDAQAFSTFWRFDHRALVDALGATPVSRFRLAEARPTGPARERDLRALGYAIVGRSRERGFLQRLAVAPEHQGRGLGAVLVTDALRWLHRRGVASVVVNTQEDNLGALALYRRLGFDPRPERLLVLVRRFEPTAVVAGTSPA